MASLEMCAGSTQNSSRGRHMPPPHAEVIKVAHAVQVAGIGTVVHENVEGVSTPALAEFVMSSSKGVEPPSCPPTRWPFTHTSDLLYIPSDLNLIRLPCQASGMVIARRKAAEPVAALSPFISHWEGTSILLQWAAWRSSAPIDSAGISSCRWGSSAKSHSPSSETRLLAAEFRGVSEWLSIPVGRPGIADLNP